jgi:hypothetical protein
VRADPRTGRKSLFLSAHAGAIAGWTIPEARMLLRDLTEHANAASIRLPPPLAARRSRHLGQSHDDAPGAPLRA